VPAAAHGFKIASARMIVTDLGTSFGFETHDGAAAVHVFEGKVQLTDAAAAPKRELLAGQALGVELAERGGSSRRPRRTFPMRTLWSKRPHRPGSSSGWFVERVTGPARIIAEPVSKTNFAGTAVAIAVVAGGSPSLTYQWFKNGVSMGDGGNVSGTRSATLSLIGLSIGDSGDYSVVICNTFGCATSQVAALTVLDPFITNEPLSRTNNPGTDANFNVVAAGTTQLAYQWQKKRSQPK